MESTTRTDVSIIIPTDSEKHWHQLVRTVASARAQVHQVAEVVVVVDHNPALYRLARRDLAGVTVLENLFTKGVSGNRNTGAFHSWTPLIAFLDDDTIAEPEWLSHLVQPFVDPAVIGAGGEINPNWAAKRPRWMPDEFLWTVGSSYTGLPKSTAAVRNLWSASMIVRRDAFMKVGGFRNGSGKLGDKNRPEITELCLRMCAVSSGHWMYVPSALIRHDVPADRSTFRFFLRRCYAEGRGKVQMAGLNIGTDSLGSERDFLRSLPKAVIRHIAAATRGQGVAHALRAGSVVAAVAAAGWGGAVEALAGRRADRRPVTQASR